MKSNLFIAIKLTIICLLFFSGIYTAIIYGIAQIVPNKGRGEVLVKNGNTYYINIGQKFSNDKYFYSRPSAVDYNASGSAGSNKGPSNSDYLLQVKARVDTFLNHNPEMKKSDIPTDLLTSSGSGLDPNISIQAATIQIKRVSKIRGIAEANLQQLILSNTEEPLFGLFGPEKINVLKLNIALDKLN